jgi:exonuclease VII large subunit
MKEKTLMKVCVVGSIICLLALYLITNLSIATNIKLGDIDKSFIGKFVNITGKISKISVQDGNYFITLSDDTGSIKIALWEDTIKILEMKNINISELNKGEEINVIGEVQIYKGELEILPIKGYVKLVN